MTERRIHAGYSKWLSGIHVAERGKNGNGVDSLRTDDSTAKQSSITVDIARPHRKIATKEHTEIDPEKELWTRRSWMETRGLWPTASDEAHV